MRNARVFSVRKPDGQRLELDIKLYNAEQKAGRKMQVWPDVCGGKLVLTDVTKSDARVVEDILTAAMRLIARALNDRQDVDEAQAFDMLEARFAGNLEAGSGGEECPGEESGESPTEDAEPEGKPEKTRRPGRSNRKPAKQVAPDEGDVTAQLIGDAESASKRGPELRGGRIR